MPARRLRPVALAAAAIATTGLIAMAPSAASADDSVSFCGTPAIDEINVNEMTWSEYAQQSGYYDGHIARLEALTGLQETLGMSREDFCAAATELINEGGKGVVTGALGEVMAGNNGWIRNKLFEEALGRATEQANMPTEIPAVGGGSDSTQPLTISDTYYGGTDGSPAPSSTWGPQAGAYWYPNGLGVAVDCVTTGPSYDVKFASGASETWSTYFHVTDGRYVKAGAVQETSSDSDTFGLPTC